jgi:hypothetical protein
MTYAQLEQIFKQNIGVSFQAALDAVYSHGYFDHAGISVGPNTQPIAKSRPAPTGYIMVQRPD